MGSSLSHRNNFAPRTEMCSLTRATDFVLTTHAISALVLPDSTVSHLHDIVCELVSTLAGLFDSLVRHIMRRITRRLVVQCRFSRVLVLPQLSLLAGDQ